ncbi:probable LRR receptor-like serine/threonine-protein kinase At1g06840 isoform X3 [Ananas comosus]|uniref:non-specific serine/threonine protein kinase n=1 Tax=Ananas comosus TaxID=4615 RepID=A0A6P5G2U7_ANACO|nr:probable LRR receptor-like serine/threonine-protein kinase At1g06840 isoform X3 [Ananas comosus]
MAPFPPLLMHTLTLLSRASSIPRLSNRRRRLLLGRYSSSASLHPEYRLLIFSLRCLKLKLSSLWSFWSYYLFTMFEFLGHKVLIQLKLLKLNLSGSLAPELGHLSHLKIFDVMWNKINGSIPKEMGNITTLKLLLVSGNQLSGSIPEEIGYLPNLDRLQIDQNQISGPIPKSFANLSSIKHFHMNNNSLSGQISPELSRLPLLLHFLMDNNNLTGYLPPELSEMPKLKILQLDNNNFSGSIPDSYGNMRPLLKLSLRNCSVKGTIPDLSGIPQLGYLDLSWNQLEGSIPTNKLSTNVTTIDLSHNFLNGTIPSNFSGLPNLQLLSLANNLLYGSVPSNLWDNITFGGNRSLVLDFQSNSLTTVPDAFDPPTNVTVLLHGNPACAYADRINIANFCQPQLVNKASGNTTRLTFNCSPCPADVDYEYNPSSPIPCFCAVPLGVDLRLKSPGISDFRPYIYDFEINLTSLLKLFVYQLYIDRYIWENGPRLNMHLRLFPSNSSLFNVTEILRLRRVLSGWEITLSDVFGPYELLNFTLGSYANGISKGGIVGILMGVFAGVTALSVIFTVFIMRRRSRKGLSSERHSLSKFSIKIDGVKCFTFEEMALATDNFNSSTQVGQGGYGNVYKGILADGTVVAVKRAHEESLQGSKEFCTEIELLSRLHHRNLVSLIGYCDEQDEQMLVYEFMPNGTLRDHLSAKSVVPLNFSTRLHIALGAAKGILYLHTEADPPIFHRDIKASNILLDSKFIAKVADFGLSKLAPEQNIEGIFSGYVSTVVKGTPGYLDPEYFLTHKLTDRSDVYSLGVVFLELLTGMKPIAHGKNIVREASLACHSGKMFSIIDSRMGPYPPECIEQFVLLALRCCQDETDARPSMSEVVRELEIIWKMMPEAYITTPTEESIATSSDKVSKSVSKSSALRNPNSSSNVSTSDDVYSGMHTVSVTPR